MTTDAAFVSRYDVRVKQVRDVLKDNTELPDDACQAHAVRLLHTMDAIPERMR
ncbi:DUF6307 family protein [Amycolatopsis australiensis]|uniref:Uncharacterized protein n=1 Tax=Amycolatopsis australiensis TaxID=546364 RepID=A0A1K1S6Z4_9PSEU|nr:DUF6307 family protein [Amycolatopsis australiensis]SFW79986.1 hypothetical protein SAMN04489730_4883 [Amycolatopsis australiensis]